MVPAENKAGSGFESWKSSLDGGDAVSEGGHLLDQTSVGTTGEFHHEQIVGSGGVLSGACLAGGSAVGRKEVGAVSGEVGSTIGQSCVQLALRKPWAGQKDTDELGGAVGHANRKTEVDGTNIGRADRSGRDEGKKGAENKVKVFHFG
jgi:hypothetical protein